MLGGWFGGKRFHLEVILIHEGIETGLSGENT